MYKLILSALMSFILMIPSPIYAEEVAGEKIGGLSPGGTVVASPNNGTVVFTMLDGLNYYFYCVVTWTNRGIIFNKLDDDSVLGQCVNQNNGNLGAGKFKIVCDNPNRHPVMFVFNDFPATSTGPEAGKKYSTGGDDVGFGRCEPDNPTQYDNFPFN